MLDYSIQGEDRVENEKRRFISLAGVSSSTWSKTNKEEAASFLRS
jgi:hypothetical protein